MYKGVLWGELSASIFLVPSARRPLHIARTLDAFRRTCLTLACLLFAVLLAIQDWLIEAQHLVSALERCGLLLWARSRPTACQTWRRETVVQRRFNGADLPSSAPTQGWRVSFQWGDGYATQAGSVDRGLD